MIFDDDEDELYDNRSDLYFVDTKMQCKNKYHKAGVEVLDQIIEKFNTSNGSKKKVQLLSLAPKSWGRRKLMKVFNISERKARNVNKLVLEHGILKIPNTKTGRAFIPETETIVVGQE